MKKMNIQVVALLLAGGMTMNSCIGSYSLFNKYAEWQRTMTSNKFVNAIVGFVLTPICGSISLVVDHFVLNTIEFWSGSNPVTANIGKTQQVMGQDGRYYAVKTLKDGYEITAPTGEVTLFTYNKADNCWSMTQNGVTKEIFRFTEDGKAITVSMPNGDTQDFTLNEQGVYDARMTAQNGYFFAMR